MTVFRWAMRNGAPILFVIAMLLFVVSLAGHILVSSPTLGSPGSSFEVGQGPVRFWVLIMAVAQAMSNSATIFAAACIVHLLNRRFGDAE